jgi:glycosyltransferase involved in cell wall biosynthesis
LLEQTREHLSLPEEYILYVGTIEPRKNVTSIARAYALLPENIQKRYKLVISGGLGWYTESITNEIKSIRTPGEIKMIGYSPHDMLPALYNMASLFVFPSFYEGFGLPPLEAMACGVPVITSGNSSLTEVAGDAGLIIDPTNVEQISNGMQKLLEDENLRKSLMLKGIERAKIFTPYSTASQIIGVFEELQRGANNP